MDLKDIGFEVVDFIYLASNMDHWLTDMEYGNTPLDSLKSNVFFTI